MAELLAKLVQSEKMILLTSEDFERMRKGVQGFLNLKSVVSKQWKGQPTVLDEMKRSSHEKDKPSVNA